MLEDTASFCRFISQEDFVTISNVKTTLVNSFKQWRAPIIFQSESSLFGIVWHSDEIVNASSISTFLDILIE